MHHMSRQSTLESLMSGVLFLLISSEERSRQ